MYIADGKTNGPAFSWPDGKRIAVMVTFDYDAEFLRISRAKSKGTTIGFTDFSRGQYGPHEGLARCLNMLDTMNIKSTFFVPGAVIETYRDTVEEIHRRGHELAGPGLSVIGWAFQKSFHFFPVEEGQDRGVAVCQNFPHLVYQKGFIGGIVGFGIG